MIVYYRPGGRSERGYDLVVDENVIDGMACLFPPSAGLAMQRLALDGISWLLRPGGRLLTLSFTAFERPPYSTALAGWSRLPASAASCRLLETGAGPTPPSQRVVSETGGTGTSW